MRRGREGNDRGETSRPLRIPLRPSRSGFQESAYETVGKDSLTEDNPVAVDPIRRHFEVAAGGLVVVDTAGEVVA